MRIVIMIVSLLLAATYARATCPRAETVSADTDPPVVSLEKTGKFTEIAMLVRTERPVCLTLLELVAQGSGLRYAALLGPSETHVATARKSRAGLVRFTFVVDTWLPAGETRYIVWFQVGPWYLALDPGLVLWFRDGAAALPARIENGIVGTLKPRAREPFVLPKGMRKVFRARQKSASRKGRPVSKRQASKKNTKKRR